MGLRTGKMGVIYRKPGGVLMEKLLGGFTGNLVKLNENTALRISE